MECSIDFHKMKPLYGKCAGTPNYITTKIFPPDE